MRTSLRRTVVLAAVVIAGSVIAVAARQSPRPARPATPSSTPNLNGIWQAITTANWDIQDHSARPGPPQFGALFAEPPGQGVVDGNELPYQPAALAKRRANFEQRWTLDPEAKCYMPGVPRATYMPHPFQIIQSTGDIIIAYQYAGAFRTIHMTGKPNPVDMEIDSWMGYSRGRWEGRTLVVEASRFNDASWFDRSGNFHSEAMTVVERYNPVDADHLAYEATITDPQVFTRPWKMSFTLYRNKEKNAQLNEYKCVDFAEDLIFGHLYKK